MEDFNNLLQGTATFDSMASALLNFSPRLLAYVKNASGMLPTLSALAFFNGTIDIKQPVTGAITAGSSVDDLLGLKNMLEIKGLNVDYWDALTFPAGTSLAVDVTAMWKLETLSAKNRALGSQANHIYGNLDNMVNLKVLDLFNAGTGLGNKFSGILTNRTNMTYINLYSAISETLLARPLYGQNPNLTYIEDGGFISNSFMDNAATNMRSLTKLTTFKVQNNSNILTATVNKILNELLLAKQGGGVLTSVFITGNAPTGQGLSDKATLQALGVAVTTS